MDKTYIIETSHQLCGSYRPWSGCAHASSMEQARKDLADAILGQLDSEDRGEDYERGWNALAERAKTAEVGDEFEFDERKWRIIEDAE